MSTSLVRLLRRREFLAVAATQRKSVAPGVILQAGRILQHRPPDGVAVVRVGLTVSKKVGNAVIRNRVRRRLRAAANIVLPQKAKPGVDLVLIGRKGSIHRPFDLLCKDIETGLERLGESAR